MRFCLQRKRKVDSTNAHPLKCYFFQLSNPKSASVHHIYAEVVAIGILLKPCTIPLVVNCKTALRTPLCAAGAEGTGWLATVTLAEDAVTVG